MRGFVSFVVDWTVFVCAAIAGYESTGSYIGMAVAVLVVSAYGLWSFYDGVTR